MLGPLEALVDGVPVLLGPPQQRALLALLLLQPERGRLARPDRGRAVGRAASGHRDQARPGLRVRPAQGARAPTCSSPARPATCCRSSPTRCDLDRFQRHVDEGDAALAAGTPARAAEAFRAALALWRGPALADLALVPFAQARGRRGSRSCAWRRSRDRDRGRPRARARRRGARARGADRRAPAARAPARPAHARAVPLGAPGRGAQPPTRTRAARWWTSSGIEPGRELRELEQAILRQDPELDAPARGAGPPPARAAFVGRERELGRAGRRARGRARRYAGGSCWSAGEPGIGKSRLAEELAHHARARGARVLRRALLGGRRRAGLLAVGPGAARLRARGRARRAARAARRRRRRARDAPAGAGRPGRRPPAPHRPEARASGSSRRSRPSCARPPRRGRSSSASTTCTPPTRRRCCSCASSPAQLAGAPLLVVGCYRDTEVGPELADDPGRRSRASPRTGVGRAAGLERRGHLARCWR